MSEKIEGKTITLYLTSWQKRMITDQLKAHAKRLGLSDPYANLNKMIFHYVDPKTFVMYIVPDPDFYTRGGFLLHLTDEQIVQVTEFTGIRTKINALTITPAMMQEKIVAFG